MDEDKIDNENENEEDIELELEDLEFAVLVSKNKDGEIQMRPVDKEHAPRTLDDVYEVLCILKRNIEAQHTAASIHQFMMQAAQQVQKQQAGETDSGIVIPQNKNIK